ncbi:MAG: hypothetical protein J0H53_08400 [Rhizobiales bacterium]|nr:hypothetical protein [Hyphomicrobiales bacterium]OJU34143.1 MAG: hypothetical protein BGN94_05250 [Rhizobiales bacterium 68-8]
MHRTAEQFDAIRHVEMLLERPLLPSEVADIPSRDASETMVRISFRGYELWLYCDGAEIQGRGRDERLEIYDYPDLAALYADFKRRIAMLSD